MTEARPHGGHQRRLPARASPRVAVAGAVACWVCGAGLAALGWVSVGGAVVALAAVLGGLTMGEATDHLLRRGLSVAWRVEAAVMALAGLAVALGAIGSIVAVFFGWVLG